MRAPGLRPPQHGISTHASCLPALTGERWFYDVPECDPLAQPLRTRSSPAPAQPPGGSPPAKALTEAELGAERRERARRAATGPPFAAAAFEMRTFWQGFTSPAAGTVRNYHGVSLEGRVSGELHAALTDYTTCYREKTSQTTDVRSLMVQTRERFVETDREFLAWRRRT